MTVSEYQGISLSAPIEAVRQPVSVRQAVAAEHEPIRELLRAGYGRYAANVAPEVWTAYFDELLDLERHSRDGQLMVAVLGGNVVGYAAFYPDASVQNLGWPPGWAGGRGLVVHPGFRRFGIAAMLLTALEKHGIASGASAFAFHTSAFMTGAIPLYERLGYRRAPEFDLDLNIHYRSTATPPWPALAYLRRLDTSR